MFATTTLCRLTLFAALLAVLVSVSAEATGNSPNPGPQVSRRRFDRQTNRRAILSRGEIRSLARKLASKRAGGSSPKVYPDAPDSYVATREYALFPVGYDAAYNDLPASSSDGRPFVEGLASVNACIAYCDQWTEFNSEESRTCQGVIWDTAANNRCWLKGTNPSGYTYRPQEGDYAILLGGCSMWEGVVLQAMSDGCQNLKP